MGAGRAPGRLSGSAAHFKVCKAKREAPELFQVNFLFHREVPQGESCPRAGRTRPVTCRSGRKRAQPCPASNPPKPAVQVGLLWDEPVPRKPRRAPALAQPLPCRQPPHAGQLLRPCHLPAEAEGALEAAHPVPPNKQCCYERQGGVCPRRRFSSSPFQAWRFVPLPVPPAPSISHTSAFAQCQRCPRSCPEQLLPALSASTGTQPGQGMPSPSWNTFMEKFAVALTDVLAAGLAVLSRASCCHHS